LRLCGYEHQRGNGKIAGDNIMSRCQSSTKLADVTRSTFVVGNLRLLRMMRVPSGDTPPELCDYERVPGNGKDREDGIMCRSENSTK
jgi:hypothetical protein